MNIITLSSTKFIVCPTTGFQVPTKAIAMPETQETKGLERFALWWHCKHCNGWHILGLYPSASDEVPINELSTFEPTRTYH